MDHLLDSIVSTSDSTTKKFKLERVTESTAKKKRAKQLCLVKGCSRPTNKRNSICSSCSMYEWRKNNPKKASYKNFKQNAKRRGHAFALTFSQFCELLKDVDFTKDRRATFQIDRIDNSGGYTIDNVQVLTALQNRVKGNCEKYRKPLLDKSGEISHTCEGIPIQDWF